MACNAGIISLLQLKKIKQELRKIILKKYIH